MKRIFKLKFIALAALVATVSLQSCLDNDDTGLLIPNALVTAKTDTDNTFYLQLDEKTTLLPTNLKKSPFGEKEVRALVNYVDMDDNSGNYTKAVYVNWIDSLLTKNTVPNKYEDNDMLYGDDPVEIINDWVTIAEDGYLTLRFRTFWGGHTFEPHYIYLVRDVDEENPYCVELRHDANGDNGGMIKDALVAFNLKDLPDTEGKTVKLKLVWKSYSGKKSVEFDYCTRKASGAKNIIFNDSDFAKALK